MVFLGERLLIVITKFLFKLLATIKEIHGLDLKKFGYQTREIKTGLTNLLPRMPLVKQPVRCLVLPIIDNTPWVSFENGRVIVLLLPTFPTDEVIIKN